MGLATNNSQLTTRRNVSIAAFTTFKIGGKVKFFVEVKNSRELIEAIKHFKKEKIPYWIIAGGSNVVFPDGKINGAVIKISSPNNTKTLYPIILTNNGIKCWAGMELGKVIRFANKNELAGLESLAGIPGSIGGAIIGNAGAYGQSISDVIEKVEIYDGRETRWLTKKQCQFGYRESIFKKRKWLVLNVVLKLKKGNAKKLEEKSRQIRKVRNKKYPPKLCCPGSFFKNVRVKEVSKKSLALVDESKIIDGKIPVGWILEQVGAKGMKSGRVCVADYHGNLLIAKKGATCRDVKKLAGILKRKVKQKFGINLEEEIRYLGA